MSDARVPADGLPDEDVGGPEDSLVWGSARRSHLVSTAAAGEEEEPHDREKEMMFWLDCVEEEHY